jgi:hypothetical protein
MMLSTTTDDGATAKVPRIVNGLTIRPREKVNLWTTLWPYGILFMPDILALLALVAIGIYQLARSHDANGKR